MSDMSRLSPLKQLTTAELMAAQSAMAALVVRERGLRENLSNLIAQKREAAERAVSTDPATRAGANMRWQTWADERRAMINTELARVLGQKAEAKAKLKRAFGKDQALGALIERQARQSREQQNRRSD